MTSDRPLSRETVPRFLCLGTDREISRSWSCRKENNNDEHCDPLWQLLGIAIFLVAIASLAQAQSLPNYTNFPMISLVRAAKLCSSPRQDESSKVTQNVPCLRQRIEQLLREIFEGHEDFLGVTPD